MDNFQKGAAAVIVGTVATVLVNIAIFAGIVAVVIHFIKKFW